MKTTVPRSVRRSHEGRQAATADPTIRGASRGVAGLLALLWLTSWVETRRLLSETRRRDRGHCSRAARQNSTQCDKAAAFVIVHHATVPGVS